MPDIPDSDALSKFETYSFSSKSDVQVVDSKTLNKINPDQRFSYFASLNDDSNLDDIVNAAKNNAESVIIEFEENTEWKIIPLENLIAELHGLKTKIFTVINDPSEIKMMFTILELGVDGVLLRTSSIDDVNRLNSEFNELSKIDLSVAEIIEIKEVGMGERACVDTASMLNQGEGLLVGNQANFMFLMHNESAGSGFTSPRPFRVNAGAVQCYTLLPDNRTKYLSELESGTEVMIVSHQGVVRTSIVGRLKIESRPLFLVRAKSNDKVGGVLIQNAETIAFVKEDGKPISTTSLKVGDKILVKTESNKGRHFGMEVEEYILEK
ncbi:MAG: 3-dehydroquinate synthase [Thaumarchaeota archaeon]|nr:3-dehydroquinate synthase [Nitrososphaerota archaeon]